MKNKQIQTNDIPFVFGNTNNAIGKTWMVNHAHEVKQTAIKRGFRLKTIAHKDILDPMGKLLTNRNNFWKINANLLIITSVVAVSSSSLSSFFKRFANVESLYFRGCLVLNDNKWGGGGIHILKTKHTVETKWPTTLWLHFWDSHSCIAF